MIIVTGGAGFIGSRCTNELNKLRKSEIIIVDDLSNGEKFRNLVDCTITDYFDKDDFLKIIERDHGPFSRVEAVIHLGACSTTTEMDGKYIMRNNYSYSKSLLNWCLKNGILFIYASSAAVYGNSKHFSEEIENEIPLNPYGYSKFLFDQYVRKVLPESKSPIVGLRYFNVYGQCESHKGSMVSIVYQFRKQLLETGRLRLFEGTDGFADGEQRRDFLHVDDAVRATLWFLGEQEISGIYNLGSGASSSFNDLARAVINYYGKGEITYIPFPDHLRNSYQSFTEANTSRLRSAGCDILFRPIELGVPEYLQWLDAQ